MKHQRAAFLASIITTASVCAFGATHFIETSDGQVSLGELPCRGLGQDATFIGRDKLSGTAVGCWTMDSGYVVTVRWSHLIGPTGKVLATNQVTTYAAPASLRTEPMSAQVRALVDEANQLNSDCRGKPGDQPETMAICRKRDAQVEKLTRLGWCWGPLMASRPEQRWMRCEDDPDRRPAR